MEYPLSPSSMIRETHSVSPLEDSNKIPPSPKNARQRRHEKRKADGRDVDDDEGVAQDVKSAIAKGRSLRHDFGRPVPQSRFVHYSSLANNGWVIVSPPWQTQPPDEDDMIVLYKDNHISTRASDNLYCEIKHVNRSTSSGRQGLVYEATGAYVEVFLNPCAITSYRVASPVYRASQQDPKWQDHQIIPLRHWSDVAFLLWQEYCHRRNLPVSGLRFVFRHDIINTLTNEIIRYAVPKAGLEGPRGWRDQPPTIPFGSPGFDAIIGSPNGRGVAHLLTQHRAALGDKVITAVTLFCKVRPDGFLGLKRMCYHIHDRSST